MPYITLRISCSLLASNTVMHSCKSVFLKLCESTISLSLCFICLYVTVKLAIAQFLWGRIGVVWNYRPRMVMDTELWPAIKGIELFLAQYNHRQ